MKFLILVAGMHRSGTSAVTGVLTSFAKSLPKTLMPANSDNRRGFFESAPFAGLHDEILASGGSRWQDWTPFPEHWRFTPEAETFRRRAAALLRDEFGEAEFAVLKDPRICRFLPFWLDVARVAGMAARIVIPFRHPGEVGRSLAIRDGMNEAEGLLLWLRHVIDAERDTRGLVRSVVSMDDLLDDWRSTLARVIRQLHLPWGSPDGKSIDGFLSRQLKHQNVAACQDVGAWASDGYKALCGLTDDPQSLTAAETLDGISENLRTATKLFGPLLAAPDQRADDRLALRAEAEANVAVHDRSSALRNRLNALHAEVNGNSASRGARRPRRRPARGLATEFDPIRVS